MVGDGEITRTSGLALEQLQVRRPRLERGGTFYTVSCRSRKLGPMPLPPRYACHRFSLPIASAGLQRRADQTGFEYMAMGSDPWCAMIIPEHSIITTR